LLSVLIVEDDDDIRFALKRIIQKLDCEPVEADSIEGAVSILTTRSCDVVFSDVGFPGDKSGVEILDLVAEKNLPTKVVMMSCAMDDDAISFLLDRGAAKCLKKPFFKAVCQETLSALFPEQMSAA